MDPRKEEAEGTRGQLREAERGLERRLAGEEVAAAIDVGLEA